MAVVVLTKMVLKTVSDVQRTKYTTLNAKNNGGHVGLASQKAYGLQKPISQIPKVCFKKKT